MPSDPNASAAPAFGLAGESCHVQDGARGHSSALFSPDPRAVRGRQLCGVWWFCFCCALLASLGVGGQRLGVAASLTMVGASLVIAYPVGRWLRGGMRSVPLFELICLYLLLAHCPSAFLGSLVFRGHAAYHEFSGAEVASVGLLLCVAFAAVVLGHGVVGRLCVSLPRFQVETRTHSRYFVSLLWVSVLLPWFTGRVPVQFHKAVSIVTSANACICIFVLSMLSARGGLGHGGRLAYRIGLSVYLVGQVAGGWLQDVVYVFLFLEMGKFLVTKRMALLRCAVIGLLVVSLNGSKSLFRERYWGGRIGGYRTDPVDSFGRAVDWVGMAISGASDIGDSAELTVVGRLSNLEFLSYVVVSTPSIHSHTGLLSYSYVPAMLVPRFLWPGKPSTMDLPNEIALRYGYLGEHQVGRVALDIGLITEAYMAFGWVGVVVFMFLFGVFIRLLVNTLSSPANGNGWGLVMIGLIRNGALMVTWTAASYFAGMWQTAVLITLLYLPIASVRRHP